MKKKVKQSIRSILLRQFKLYFLIRKTTHNLIICWLYFLFNLHLMKSKILFKYSHEQETVLLFIYWTVKRFKHILCMFKLMSNMFTGFNFLIRLVTMLDFQLILVLSAPHPDYKVEPSHSTKEAHYGHLYLGSCSFIQLRFVCWQTSKSRACPFELGFSSSRLAKATPSLLKCRLLSINPSPSPPYHHSETKTPRYKTPSLITGNNTY